jgi:desulfoferrodoxin (superoxide reductase-like protein)
MLILYIANSTSRAFAGIPTVTNVIAWNDDGDTVLNVTVSHSPQSQTIPHYLDYIEVNVDGDTQTFPVNFRPETTFIVHCNLGAISGTPTATVRAHRNIDGYGSWYGPVQIPEFQNPLLLLTLLFTILLVAIILRKAGKSINSIFYCKEPES